MPFEAILNRRIAVLAASSSACEAAVDTVTPGHPDALEK